MKSIALVGALFVLLLLAAFSWAAPKPEEYSINVHVSSSQWMMTPGLIGPEAYQKLNVTIDGKKYALAAIASVSNLMAGVEVLALGDYKAKLIKDEHKNAYDSFQMYEFQFPDKKTRKFTVVGLRE